MKFKFSFFILITLVSLSGTAQIYERSEKEIKEDLGHEKCKIQFLDEQYGRVINYYDSMRQLKTYLRFELYKMASLSFLKQAELDSARRSEFTNKSELAYKEALRWYGSMKIKDWETLEIKVYDEPGIFKLVDERSEPKGGYAGFYSYVNRKMRYPKEARKERIEGKVYVQFVINKDGSIDAVNVISGIGYGCDEEAVRIMRNAPNWKPAKQNGIPVYQRIQLPITFKL
ncbi:MAG: energy transducer TonB [Bacteroidota bacterium]